MDFIYFILGIYILILPTQIISSVDRIQENILDHWYDIEDNVHYIKFEKVYKYCYLWFHHKVVMTVEDNFGYTDIKTGQSYRSDTLKFRVKEFDKNSRYVNTNEPQEYRTWMNETRTSHLDS